MSCGGLDVSIARRLRWVPLPWLLVGGRTRYLRWGPYQHAYNARPDPAAHPDAPLHEVVDHLVSRGSGLTSGFPVRSSVRRENRVLLTLDGGLPPVAPPGSASPLPDAAGSPPPWHGPSRSGIVGVT